MRRDDELEPAHAIEQIFHDTMVHFRGTMPASIVKLNLNGTAVESVDVQPLIRQIETLQDGNKLAHALPVLKKIPLETPYSQSLNLSLTVPLQVGDSCMITCCDRAIDGWQETNKIANPQDIFSPRMYELTDAVCRPGVINTPTAINNYSIDSIDIRNKDADTKLRVSDVDVTIQEKAGAKTVWTTNKIDETADLIDNTASTQVTITVGSSTITLTSNKITIQADDVDIIGTNNVNVTAPQISLDGTLAGGSSAGQQPSTFRGPMQIHNTLDTTGTITTPEANINGINHSTHVHSDPQGGVTGGPQ